MQRYFVDQVLTTDDDPIYIEAADHHHLARVMRMTTGDQVYIVFADNQFCTAEIVSISEDKTLLKLVEWQTNNPELPIAITIASGLPKGDKLEWIVQKGTELGADSFIAFPSDRSIVKWDAKKTEKKRERLQKIAKEAAEQSHRVHVPTITTLASGKQLAERCGEYDAVVVAYEESAKANEKAVLASVFAALRPGMRLLVIFGPEGGISEQEIQLFKAQKAHFAGLGPRILRTETAPLYLLAAASYQFELNNE